MTRLAAVLAACATSPPTLANHAEPRCGPPVDLVGDAHFLDAGANDDSDWRLELELDGTSTGHARIDGRLDHGHTLEMAYTLAVRCIDGRIHAVSAEGTFRLVVDLERGTGAAATPGMRWTVHGLRRK